MTPLLADLASWWLQAGLLLGAGLVLPALVRLRDPGMRLRLGQVLLAAAILLPLVQPSVPVGGTSVRPEEAKLSLTVFVTAEPTPAMVSFETLVLSLLAAGATLRLGWLRPAIVLPERFGALEPTEQEAVACHELLHVVRRDSWAVLLEEGARVLLRAQPAAWGVLSGISLASRPSTAPW